MTRLSWGAPDERYYEDGVDQGVLYVDDVGYVWNGLVSISEKPSGGEHQSYYLDGIKYLNLASAEEYEATINAISCPLEFSVCDGVMSLYQGLFVTQQKRKPFGLSYRTMINDALGPDKGYKIHLVYNALAAPSERNNQTRSDSFDMSPLSWYIQAVPPNANGLTFKPSAHFVIDSRFSPPGILADIEGILYGDEDSDARLPTQTEILSLFEVYATLQVTDNGDGTATIVGPDEVVVVDTGDPTQYTITWGSVVSTGIDTYSISSL